MHLDPAGLSACVLAFSLLMYMMLDGADLGVGMLLAWFPEEDDRRRLTASVLPVWDANETWLVLLAGGMLALFPQAYSWLLTALYIPLFAMLLALFARAVALEYRSHASARVREYLDAILIWSSALAAFFQGAMAGCVLEGVTPASALAWFAPVPFLSGCGVMAGYLLLGCCWVRWRLQGEAGEWASLLACLFLVALLVVMVALSLLLPGVFLHGWRLTPGKCLVVLAMALVIALPFLLHSQRLMLPLLAALLLLSCWLGLQLVACWPWLIPGVITLHKAASPQTQAFVLWGIAVLIPVTLAYNSWAFWIFRGKVH